MSLSYEDIAKLATLANMSLTDEEAQKLQKDLSSLLDYMHILDEVDTKGVEPLSQVTGLENVSQEDEVLSSRSTRDELLASSSLPKDRMQIKVPNVL